MLENTMSGESMATNTLGKINERLNVLYRNQNYLNYLNYSLRRHLCNALIQLHFDFAIQI